MSTPNTSSCFVVNPKSAGGRTKREWEKLFPSLQNQLGNATTRYTLGIGDGINQTRQALDEGYSRIVSVGGDGTNNEVLNGFLQSDGTPYKPHTQFAFFPMGSGGDFGRTLPCAENVQQLAEQLLRGQVNLIDVGKITFQTPKQANVERLFLNIASIGVSADINMRVNRSRKWLGGTLTYFLHSFLGILAFENPTMRLSLDDGPIQEGKKHLVIVGNGRYFGGGMKAAPDAIVDDGWLDVILVGDYHKAQLILEGSRIYRGTHIHMPQTRFHRVKKIHIEADRQIWIDVDGEVPGYLPATIEVIPRTLPICLPLR